MRVYRFRFATRIAITAIAYVLTVGIAVQAASNGANDDTGHIANDRSGQIRQPVQSFETEVDAAGRKVFFWGQVAPGDRLVLTPNECYFTGSLTAFGQGPDDIPRLDMNQNKSFSGVTGWDSIDDEIRWHIWFTHTGTVQADLQMAVSSQEAGSNVLMRIEAVENSNDAEGAAAGKVGQTPNIVSNRTSVSDGQHAAQPWNVELQIDKPGLHTLTLSGIPVSENADVGRFTQIDLTGDAVRDARVLRSRWRPAAVHAGSFTNSQLAESGEGTDIWVMQVRPQMKKHSVYAPVTTPFGYFGSTFAVDGTVGSPNFSLWSYGRGKEEPPIERLSHLLATGCPEADFSGFGHEGTGVKLRNAKPFEGHKMKVETLALRREIGDVYHTYYSYYLDPANDQWHLYGVGRKYVGDSRPRGNPTLSPGAFVEVPGVAERQRTGDARREIHFRGWTRGSNSGDWQQLDTMGGPGRSDGLLSKNWWVTPDGWFAMSMGGMEHYPYGTETAGGTKLSTDQLTEKLPPFLSDKLSRQLSELPASVTLLPVEAVSATTAVIPLEVTAQADQVIVQVFWGESDSLTFAELWANSTEPAAVTPGVGSVSLSKLKPATQYFYRILYEDANCRTWSFETGTFRTK